jgi:ABC-type uncharacterized transport system involved in gliding motility auxiliary subunit
VAGLLIFLGILVAANVLVAGLRLRWDITENKLFTLSDGMKNVLGGLDHDVTLKFYFSRSSPTVPVALKQYGERVLDLLQECERASNGRLFLEVYDPQPDSDEEEWAQRYGLSGQPIGMLGAGGIAYLGIVAISGAKEAVIPMLSPSVEPQLEYLVAQLITETTIEKKRRIGLMSPLPLLGDTGRPYAFQMGSEPWAVVQELRKLFDVVAVRADGEPIPDDLDTLVVVYPRGFTLQDTFQLDQFVLRGGHLVIFQDPLCLADADPQGQDLRKMVSARADLNKLTVAWGIEMEGTRVVADPTAATSVRFGNGITSRSMAWLTLRRANLDKDEIATASLDFMYVPFAGAFKGKPAAGITMTPLIRSTDGAGTMGSFTAISTEADMSDFSKEVEPLSMSVRLAGRFVTAFPEGKPLDPSDTNAAEQAAGSWLTESAKDGIVVLVADCDMLSDRVAVAPLPFGHGLYQRTCDNIDFAVNVISQLAGDSALITLRSRDTFRRPFDRVDRLELDAAMRGREQQIALQGELDELKARMTELEANKDPKQKFVMSPEQEKELEKFRKQQFETQRELRVLNRNLNREIEDLGLKLKIGNMAAVPALVAAFGLAVGLRRRLRAPK